MKLIMIKIFKIVLRGIYFFQKMAKTDKKLITFLSRQSGQPSLDFSLLQQAILKKKPDIHTVVLCRKLDGAGYFFHILKQMHYIARSKVVITDTYIIPISILKHKKDLRVFQIWHAVGSVKQFGYQTVGKKDGRDERVAKILNMHANYDYVLSGSRAMVQYFAQAFNVPPQRVKISAPPKLEYFMNNEQHIRERVFCAYPDLAKKQNILYAPTYRKNAQYDTRMLFSNVDFSKYNLIVKGHPVREFATKDERIYTCEGFSAFELIAAADYVITDYSAISIEAAAAGKPVFLYVYDYETYSENTGLNIDIFKELPGCVFKDAGELMAALDSQNYNQNQLVDFKNKYAGKIDGALDLLSDFILELQAS